MRLPALAVLLALAGPLCAAAPPRDQAFYRERPLLEREKQEETDRDRRLAERRGVPYRQAEEAPGRRLTLDFSRLERPRDPAEFARLWHQPPVRQWWTNTCWSFSATSFLESEIKRQTGRELKLSEMWPVYWDYVAKVKEFVRTKGTSLVAEGSESEAVLLRLKEHGAVRASDYPGIRTEGVLDHSLLIEELRTYLAGVKQGDAWDAPTVVACARAILDKHLGRPPETIAVEGRITSPQAFLREVTGLDLDAYVEFMSLMHVPFYTKGEYPVPDNWWHSREYLNVPLDAWYGALKGALLKGYSVCIGGDVSEPGYEGGEDVAIVPTFDCPPEAIDQSSREFRFSNKTTDDDHGIHLVGFLRKAGHDWFLVKDSARSAQRGVPGYTFYRDDYVRLKMLTFLVHKDAVKELLARFPKGS